MMKWRYLNGCIYLFYLILGWSVSSAASKQNNYFFYSYLNSSNNQIVINATNSQLNPVDVPNWTIQAFYNASQNLSGWDILEVMSNPMLSDENQAYHAGYVEGYITRQQIWNYFWNTIENMTSNHSNIANKYIQDYFEANNQYVEEMITKHGNNDPFWYQTNLVYKQIRGMLDGYNNATKDENLPKEFYLTHINFLSLHFLQELPDIVNSMQIQSSKNDSSDHVKSKGKHPRRPGRSLIEFDFGTHCSALIKILPGNSDVYIGHDTWTSFTQMNRIIKRYKLPYKVSSNSSDIIPGTMVAFSSYPGNVASVDDFYVISSGIVTLETTNEIYNNASLKDIRPAGQVLELVRNVVANRLAKDGKSWDKYFRMNNSGTYNNQWMIIDLNKFRPGFDPQEGFLTVLEQAPNLIISEDQTTHMLQHGYWASYNIPFYPKMYQVTGNEDKAKNNSWYSYKENARAKIFAKEQSKVVDLDSMIWLMRYNRYEKDAYSVCETCDPKPNACNAIASRCDLNPVNGNYSLRGLKPMLFGATDSKIVSFSLFSQGLFWAIGGPTSDEVPPFSWSKTKLDTTSKRHMGQPDEWKFDPIYSSWVLPYYIPSDSEKNGHTTETNDDFPTTTVKSKKNGASPWRPFSFTAYAILAVVLAFMAQ